MSVSNFQRRLGTVCLLSLQHHWGILQLHQEDATPQSYQRPTAFAQLASMSTKACNWVVARACSAGNTESKAQYTRGSSCSHDLCPLSAYEEEATFQIHGTRESSGTTLPHRSHMSENKYLFILELNTIRRLSCIFLNLLNMQSLSSQFRDASHL